MKRIITIALSIILALIIAAPMASGQSSDTNQSTSVWKPNSWFVHYLCSYMR
jgi:hypothetical protein